MRSRWGRRTINRGNGRDNLQKFIVEVGIGCDGGRDMLGVIAFRTTVFKGVIALYNV